MVLQKVFAYGMPGSINEGFLFIAAMRSWVFEIVQLSIIGLVFSETESAFYTTTSAMAQQESGPPEGTSHSYRTLWILLYGLTYTTRKMLRILKFSRFFVLFRELALIFVFKSRYWDNFLDFFVLFHQFALIFVFKSIWQNKLDP